jgi:hypothetical protein
LFFQKNKLKDKIFQKMESKKVNVVYRYYESEAGLEEIQAEIYNTAVKRYGGNPATAEQIKTRYQDENFDPKGVRYAFDDQGKPLTYIQTRRTPNFVYIGYPWAIDPNSTTTKEAQTKLFDEMLEYVKLQNPEKDIVLGNIQNNWNEAIDFVKKRNFEVRNKNLRYSFTVSDLAKTTVPRFKSKIAEVDDVPKLVKLMDKEPAYENTFPDEEAATNFFKGCVERGETIMIYDDAGELISAGAITGGDIDQNIFLQFTVTDITKMAGWKAVLVELAKFYDKKGLGDKNFVITPDLEEEQVKFYEENNAKVFSESYLYNVVTRK